MNEATKKQLKKAEVDLNKLIRKDKTNLKQAEKLGNISLIKKAKRLLKQTEMLVDAIHCFV